MLADAFNVYGVDNVTGSRLDMVLSVKQLIEYSVTYGAIVRFHVVSLQVVNDALDVLQIMTQETRAVLDWVGDIERTS